VTDLSVPEVRIEHSAALVTAGVTRPAAGESLTAPTFVVRGWALGEAARVLAIELRADGRLVRVAPVREPAPDIAAAFPDRPHAAGCGFLTRVHGRALEGAAELRLDAVLAPGERTALGTVALARGERMPRAERAAPAPPSIRGAVERLVLAEADRAGAGREGLLERPEVPALDEAGVQGRTVLDLTGDPGHVARAARARGAVLVDSVHLDDDFADLARLLDLYHRVTRVSVHDSLEALERTYDVVLMLGESPPVPRETLESLTTGTVVRS
jgi:hypothetical protein